MKIFCLIGAILCLGGPAIADQPAKNNAKIWREWQAGVESYKATERAEAEAVLNDPLYLSIVKQANDGNVAAQRDAALYLYDRKNYTEAYKWAGKAAEAGDADAQYLAGMLCLDREDCYQRAERWFIDAAKKDHFEAQRQLALSHASHCEHFCFSRDQSESLFWYTLAAAHPAGDVSGKDLKRMRSARDLLRSYLPRDKQAAVEQRVAEWQASNNKVK